MILLNALSLEEKLSILSDAAKYDVACTSSGVSRSGGTGGMGNALPAGICHSFSADGRCISLLKVLLSNECIFNCRYCINRSDNDVVRTSFTPEELCRLTLEFYRRNYIEGLFLSSGIIKNPSHTMSLMYQVLHLLRNVHHFQGYIHVKGIPGADPALLQATGFLADRMSMNLELPTAKGLATLAPSKSRISILKPMRLIQQQIQANASPMQDGYLSPGSMPSFASSSAPVSPLPPGQWQIRQNAGRPLFVPGGQSTQMLVGATQETDYQILTIAEALYRQYALKRVFYSAYVPINDDALLPPPGTPVPLLREHRLYQADFLLRFYGFQANELLSEAQPSFHPMLDPKCDWALRHLGNFPVEVMKADYSTLLRVPGIGVRSARRILTARLTGPLTFLHLKQFGVVLKRAQFFLLCSGKYHTPFPPDAAYIFRQLIEDNERTAWEILHPSSARQISLYEIFPTAFT